MPKSRKHLVRAVAMGWLRLVGSLKSYVSFAKEPYKKNDILQKRYTCFRKSRKHLVRAVAACTQIIKKVLTICVKVVQYFCIRVCVCVCACVCVYQKKVLTICVHAVQHMGHSRVLLPMRSAHSAHTHTSHAHTHAHTAQRQTVSATPYTKHIRCPRARPDASPQSLQAAREPQQLPAPIPQLFGCKHKSFFFFCMRW